MTWTINYKDLSITFQSGVMVHTYWADTKETFDKKVEQIKKEIKEEVVEIVEK